MVQLLIADWKVIADCQSLIADLKSMRADVLPGSPHPAPGGGPISN
jgi:hypothetical protein